MSDFDRRRQSGDAGPAQIHVQRSAGKRTQVQRRYGGVQRSGGEAGQEAGGSEQVQQAAQRGIAGSGGSLPFLGEIQRSFGEHDISGVRAHVGGPAAEASESMGAEGYATGRDVAFRGAPSLHTAAHEAAHVVQQRAGVHLKSGVGEVGDSYEQNADAVADRVVAGKSAVDLLPPVGSSSASGGATQLAPIQLYTKIGAGAAYDTISDDGKLAVKDHSREAWGEPANIAASNAILATNKAKAKIEEVSGADISVTAPGAAAGARATTLRKFRMVDRVSGAEAELRDDCGTANQQMLGAEAAGEKSFVAANQRGTTQEFTGKSGYHGDDHAPGGVVSTTEQLSGEIYVRIFQREFGKSLGRVDALKEWDKLAPAEKDRLGKQYGINKYAAPKVGQGVTIGSERDAPGAVPGGYNFHFALNLMGSGGDYVTLEDYDSSGVKYYFDMYGPASKAQSFAEDPGNTGALGNKTTTMVVDHPANLLGKVNAAAKMVDDPAKPTTKKSLPLGTQIMIQRKGQTWMKVEVKSGPDTGATGWILNTFFEHG